MEASWVGEGSTIVVGEAGSETGLAWFALDAVNLLQAGVAGRGGPLVRMAGRRSRVSERLFSTRTGGLTALSTFAGSERADHQGEWVLTAFESIHGVDAAVIAVQSAAQLSLPLATMNLHRAGTARVARDTGLPVGQSEFVISSVTDMSGGRAWAQRRTTWTWERLR